MPSINLGRVGFVLRGAWSSGTAYNQLDVVTYNGAAYAARTASTGVTPSSGSSVWQELTGISAAVQSAMNNAAVRFDTAQTLTGAQQTMARTNIDAASTTALGSLQTTVADMRQTVMLNKGNIDNIYSYLYRAMQDIDALEDDMSGVKTDVEAVETAVGKALSLSSSDEYAQRLPANTDLDIVLTPGNYKITTDEDAATIQNRPDSVNMSFRLIVMATTQAGRCVQIVVPNSTANFLFIRRYDQYRSGWYTWNAVASRQYISDNAVLYTQDQSSALKDAQKGVARANIGAASETDLEIAQTAIGYAMTLSSSDTYGVTRLQGADLNTIVTIGAYKVTTDADAANTQNIPDGLSVPFKLYVMGLTQSGRYAQILVPSSKNNFLYIRQYDSYSTTPWGNWHAVADRKYIEDNTVLYTQDQSSTLTDAQKTMARNNIKAAMVSGTDSEGNSTGLLIQYN